MQHPGKPGAGLSGARAVSLPGDTQANTRSAPALQVLRLQRGSEHLVRLGARATTEFLTEIGNDAGCLDLIVERLDAYGMRLTSEMIDAAGADHFPPRLATVPA